MQGSYLMEQRLHPEAGIWLLFASRSFWIAWFIKEVLLGSLNIFWIVKPSQRHSWLVNKLLRIWKTADNMIKVKIKNGEHTRFWTDNWSPYGGLECFLSSGNSNRMGVPLKPQFTWHLLWWELDSLFTTLGQQGSIKHIFQVSLFFNYHS